MIFPVTICCEYVDSGLTASSKNHQTFFKMVIALFNLKSEIFFILDTILTVLYLDPYCHYGSGSRGAISIRCGSSWIRIRIRNTGFMSFFVERNGFVSSCILCVSSAYSSRFELCTVLNRKRVFLTDFSPLSPDPKLKITSLYPSD